MKIEYLSKKSFGSIKTAVFFGESERLFPYDCLGSQEYPGNLKTLLRREVIARSSIGMSHHGFVENNLSEEFFKYDFKKMHGDSKFYQEFRKVDNLGTKTRRGILQRRGILHNADVLDISKIEYCMFPTAYVNESLDDEYEQEYFTSARIDNQLVYFIHIPSRCESIELYSEEISSYDFKDFQYRRLVEGQTEFTYEPVAVIRLGADIMCLNHSESSYYEHDPRGTFFGVSRNQEIYKGHYEKYRNRTEIDEIEYLKQKDEIDSEGLLVFSIGSTGAEILNLAFESWKNDSEPHKQQRYTALGKREYYGNLYKKDPSIVKGGNILDKVSGSLLGTKEVEKTPILNKKLKQFERKGTERYSPRKEYSVGDKVLYGGEIWVSCRNNNLETPPQLSGNWVLFECIQESLNDSIQVCTVTDYDTPAETYTSIDKRILSVSIKDIKEKRNIDLQIKCDRSYEVNVQNIYYLDSDDKKIILIQGKDFGYDTRTGIFTLYLGGPNIQKQSGEEVSDGILGSTLCIGIKAISTMTYDIRYILDGNIYIREEWEKEFGDSITVRCNGEEIGDGLKTYLGETTLSVESSDYLISDTYTEHRGDTRPYSLSDEYLEIIHTSGTGYSHKKEFEISPSSAHTIYYIELSQNTYEIEIFGGQNYEISNWYSKIPLGKTLELKIYSVVSDSWDFELYECDETGRKLGSPFTTANKDYGVDGYKQYNIVSREKKKIYFTIVD